MNSFLGLFKHLEHCCYLPFLLLALVGLFVCMFCRKYKRDFPIPVMWFYFLIALFVWLLFSRSLFLQVISSRYIVMVIVPIFFMGAAGLTTIRTIRYGKRIVWGILFFLALISFFKIKKTQENKERENSLIQCCMDVKKYQEANTDKVIGLANYSKYGPFLHTIAEDLNLNGPFWSIAELDNSDRFVYELNIMKNQCEGFCLFVSATDEHALHSLWMQNKEWGEWQFLFQTQWGNIYFIPNLSSQFGKVCQPSDVQPYTGEKKLEFYPAKKKYPPDEKETWRNAFKEKGLKTTGVTQLPGIFYLNAERAGEKNTTNLKIQMIEGMDGESAFLSLSSPDFVSFLFYKETINSKSEMHFRLVFSGQPNSFVIMKGYCYKNGTFVPLPDFAVFRCIKENDWRLGEAKVLDLDQQCDKIVLFLEFFGKEIRIQMLEVF